MAQPLGKLEEPPITEVACGVLFKPVPGLDPLALGAYWKPKEKEYPRRELKAPIAPAMPVGMELSFGPDIGPVRTWLISKNDVFIIQIQHDRFYVNWRARQEEYPRFNDWDDGNRGLLSRFMEEYASFAQFCAHELDTQLELKGVDLSKLDHLARGRHWKDPHDLAVLLPMLGPVLDLSDKEPAVSVRLSAPRDNGSIEIALESQLKVGQPPIPVIKLECRRGIRGAVPLNDLSVTIKGANAELNELFGRVIPEEQHFRFKKGWRP